MVTTTQLFFRSCLAMLVFPFLFASSASERIHDPFEYLAFLSSALFAILFKSKILDVADWIYRDFGETVTIVIASIIVGGVILQWFVMLTLPLFGRNSEHPNYGLLHGLQALFSLANAISGYLIIMGEIDL